MDLVQASVVQTGQLVQIPLKVNGNGAKWKQPTDRAEADRHSLCQFLDQQSLFTGSFDMYAATYKEIRDDLQLSSMEPGQEDVLQARQNKCRKRARNSDDDFCTKKQKRPPPNLPKSTEDGKE
jgi:hypothetical protein